MRKKIILGLSLIALLSGEIKKSYSQESKDSRLVIYGESNHFSTKQKDFVVNSIDSLKKQGYNYFAIEFFSERDSSIQNYLTSNKKYRDQNINHLLKQVPSNMALNYVVYNFYKAGFKIIPIDGPRRDDDMAKNIEKIFKEDSSAKIVCYVGALHAREMGTKDPKYTNTFAYPPLAGILKEKGLDPETIYLKEKEDIYFLNKKQNSEDEERFFDKIILIENKNKNDVTKQFIERCDLNFDYFLNSWPIFYL